MKLLKYSRRNSDGQMSIFFAVVMVVLITLIAFIINVGLFVKAKINLQNAVDAAAFSGAAVQSRQLSNIAYLNWEMRNVYKEWMFKYYVLGNLSIKDVAQPNGAAESVNFTMERAPGNNSVSDKYNFPSVCIHFADTVDICRRYEIPGLPRFTNTALPGIDESSTHFIDEIVKKKAEDCSRRSQINFYTAAQWAFGVPDPTAQAMDKIAPNIASHRMGAYPAALELAFRIRNLENMMNTVSIDSVGFNQGICYNPGNSSNISCATPIEMLQGFAYPHYERTVKAYWAAHRNLGNQDDDEMKMSFTLTELTPIPYEDPNQYALSNMLLPQDRRQKYYLDLQLHTLNLVNFYSVFTSKDGKIGNTTTQGECMVTKVGMPIPGYPYGFVKNQNVLTYYAIKGESDFVGLFSPFKVMAKLTAFSAAKPFGGRIGPKTFKQGENTSEVISRSGQRLKSASHLLGVGITASGRYKPGDAIPLEESFWIQDSEDIIGGWVQGGEAGGIRFAIPNLVYDSQPPIDMGNHLTDEKLHIVNPNLPDPTQQGLKVGLYDKEMMRALKSNLPSGIVTPDAIREAIYNVRAPTKYDAENYLIPIPVDKAKEFNLDSFGNISGAPYESGKWNTSIYGPLYNSEGVFLYQNPAQLTDQIQQYISFQDTAVKTYEQAMWLVAQRLRDQATNANSLYYSSSDMISDDRGQGTMTGNASCKSIAGAFVAYFTGDLARDTGGNCPKPFLHSLRERWAGLSGNRDLVDFHQGTWKMPSNPATTIPKLLTAYAPGPMTGGDKEALVLNPFLAENEEVARRNFYSTKFVALKSLLGADATYVEGNAPMPIFSEGLDTVDQEPGLPQSQFNGIDAAGAGVDLKDINY